MTDRLKTVYPPKTSFCGGYNNAVTLCLHYENMPMQYTEIFLVQVNLIITLSMGSIETDRVISEPCYNEVIYYRHIAK